jgi:hypothetical protein
MAEQVSSPINDERLLELVRLADPIASSGADDPDGASAMLVRLLNTARYSTTQTGRLLTRKRVLLIAIGMLVLGAAGVGIAAGSGAFSRGQKKVLELGKGAASKRAHLTGFNLAPFGSGPVTDVEVAAASRKGDAGVLRGTQNGEPVCLITILGGGGFWVPLHRLLQGVDLEVESGGSGGPNSDIASETALAGVASARVARLDLVSKDGSIIKIALAPMAGDKAFALEIDPRVVHPKLLVAYDSNGNEVMTWDGGGSLTASDRHQEFCGRSGDMSCLHKTSRNHPK